MHDEAKTDRALNCHFIRIKICDRIINWKDRYLGAICLAICMVLFIAGLWPFNFWPKNRVEWLKNENGIRVYGQGMVFSQEPLITGKPGPRFGSLSIELLVRPHKESSNTVASIFTVYDRDRQQRLEHDRIRSLTPTQAGNALTPEFILSQWKTHLLIRIPAALSGSQKNHREIGIANVLTGNITHLITITSGKGSTGVYIDGKLKKNVHGYTLLPEAQGLSGSIILGNSVTGNQFWDGTFFGLAIYDRALSNNESLDHYHAWQQHIPWRHSGSSMPIALYLFDERGGTRVRNHAGAGNHLLVPATFQPLRRTILGVPAKDQWISRSNLMDVAINILGFVPFGFFFPAWLRLAKNLPAPRVYGISMLLGFCISLAIELTQVYLPMRDSSLMDVFSNTLGTATGVLLFKYTLPVLHKVTGERMVLPQF